eukprot:SAG11_NODE_7724_length_1104_cov_1.355224_2_plen_92_part_00
MRVVSYVLGSTGVDACPDGYQPVTDVATCALAAQHLSLTHSESANDLGDTAVCNLCGGCTSRTARLSTNHGDQAQFICKGEMLLLLACVLV